MDFIKNIIKVIFKEERE